MAERRRWRLIPRIEYVNWRKEVPKARKALWGKWFSFERRWAGYLWYFNVRHHSIILDWRRNWFADLLPTEKKKTNE